MTIPSIEERQRFFKTLIEMLTDRGYKIDKEEMSNAIEQFLIGEENSFYYIITNPFSSISLPNKILIAYEQEFTVRSFREYERLMYEKKVMDGIFITGEPLNSNAKKAHKGLTNPNDPQHKKIVIFLFNELIVNITHHPWVPSHVGLNPEQEKILLSSYRITKKQFPRILSSDPVSKYYAFKRGQIVKIIRPQLLPKNSKVFGKEITYRVCI